MVTGLAGAVFFGPEGRSEFGTRVRSVGDLNNDGIADVAFAAPRAGAGYTDIGPGSNDKVGIVYVSLWARWRLSRPDRPALRGRRTAQQYAVLRRRR